MDRKMTMLDYIDEAPSVARANIIRRDELVGPVVELCKNEVPRRIVLVASGSSYNACVCALPFMRSCLGAACALHLVTPFTFTHYERGLSPDDLVLVVTQSGLSTNAIEALDALRDRGARAICLTGNVESDVCEHADAVIDYGVGEELVGYVTKGVTTLTVFLMLLAMRFGACGERVGEISGALDVAEAVRAEADPFFERHIKRFTSMDVCYCCGTEPTRGVTREGALKIGETVHIPCPAYEVEEYIHGPNLQLTPAYTCLFFDAGDEASTRVERVWRATCEVTDGAFLVTPRSLAESDARALITPPLPTPEVASLAYLPLVQLLSYRASTALGGTRQHPLMKRFKAVAAAKTGHFVNYDEDD